MADVDAEYKDIDASTVAAGEARTVDRRTGEFPADTGEQFDRGRGSGIYGETAGLSGGAFAGER